VAEERTANVAFEAPATRAYSARICFSSSGGIFPSATQPRIAAPAFAKRLDVVDVDLRERVLDPLAKLVVREEVLEGLGRRGEAAGTRTPEAASWLMSSPREAFLPPTVATSVMRSDSRGAT
jgi:hypothetical protein